jgi:hypothetical protein
MIVDIIKKRDLPMFKELYSCHFSGAWTKELANAVVLGICAEGWVEGLSEFFTCFTTEVIYCSARPSTDAKVRLIQNLIQQTASSTMLKVIINQISESSFALPLIFTLIDPFADLKEVTQGMIFNAIKRGVNCIQMNNYCEFKYQDQVN